MKDFKKGGQKGYKKIHFPKIFKYLIIRKGII